MKALTQERDELKQDNLEPGNDLKKEHAETLSQLFEALRLLKDEQDRGAIDKPSLVTFRLSRVSSSRKTVIYQSINQSNFYSANIPSAARLSGATARSVFKYKSNQREGGRDLET